MLTSQNQPPAPPLKQDAVLSHTSWALGLKAPGWCDELRGEGELGLEPSTKARCVPKARLCLPEPRDPQPQSGEGNNCHTSSASPKGSGTHGGNPDVKALCELPPSGVIIIIIICKTRGWDQLISTGSSPALVLRISWFPGWEFRQTEGAWEKLVSVGLYVPGNICKQISPFILFPQPVPGC